MNNASIIVNRRMWEKNTLHGGPSIWSLGLSYSPLHAWSLCLSETTVLLITNFKVLFWVLPISQTPACLGELSTDSEYCPTLCRIGLNCLSAKNELFGPLKFLLYQLRDKTPIKLHNATEFISVYICLLCVLAMLYNNVNIVACVHTNVWVR